MLVLYGSEMIMKIILIVLIFLSSIAFRFCLGEEKQTNNDKEQVQQYELQLTKMMGQLKKLAQLTRKDEVPHEPQPFIDLEAWDILVEIAKFPKEVHLIWPGLWNVSWLQTPILPLGAVPKPLDWPMCCCCSGITPGNWAGGSIST